MLFHMYAHADKHGTGPTTMMHQLKLEGFTPVRETYVFFLILEMREIKNTLYFIPLHLADLESWHIALQTRTPYAC